MRRITALDRIVIRIQESVTFPASEYRPMPGDDLPEGKMTEQEQEYVGRLMRINHTGEICAQGLYCGQALFARNSATAVTLRQAAREEHDHLRWCRARIDTLGGRTSRFDPFWYIGSFVIGAGSAMFGDAWSLGFVYETEKQVHAHLQNHLTRIPIADVKTRAVLTRMAEDELAHGTHAQAKGGRPLPTFVQTIMRVQAACMKTITYHL